MLYTKNRYAVSFSQLVNWLFFFLSWSKMNEDWQEEQINAIRTNTSIFVEIFEYLSDAFVPCTIGNWKENEEICEKNETR